MNSQSIFPLRAQCSLKKRRKVRLGSHSNWILVMSPVRRGFTPFSPPIRSDRGSKSLPMKDWGTRNHCDSDGRAGTDEVSYDTEVVPLPRRKPDSAHLKRTRPKSFSSRPTDVLSQSAKKDAGHYLGTHSASPGTVTGIARTK